MTEKSKTFSKETGRVVVHLPAVEADTVEVLKTFEFDPAFKSSVTLKGLDAVDDGNGGTFNFVSGEKANADGYDIVAIEGEYSDWQLVRTDPYRAGAYVSLATTPEAVLIKNASTPTEVTQELSVAAWGPWERPQSNRLRWLGQDSAMCISYTTGVKGTPGDQIQVGYADADSDSINEVNPICTLDENGKGLLILTPVNLYVNKRTSLRLLVQNLTEGREVSVSPRISLFRQVARPLPLL